MSLTKEPGLRIQTGLCSGEVTAGTMTMLGALVSGWAELLPDASAPLEVLMFANGALVGRVIAHDLQPGERFSFHHELPAEMFGPPLMVDFTVYAVDASGAGCKLPVTGTAADLARLQIGSRPDFLKAIQSPIERLKDPQMLFYTALHGLSRFQDDFAARSAAICTMGYRMNEGIDAPSEARTLFWAEVGSLLQGRPNISRGLWLRWHTSVRLVAGYTAYRERKPEHASEHFARVADLAFELSHWPTALTNVLIGIFLSGWSLYERQLWEAAGTEWRKAEGVLRLGAAISQFQNYYAFGELANAVKVAQECFVGSMQAERQGAPIDDPRYVTVGYQVDVRHLAGVAFNLGVS